MEEKDLFDTIDSPIALSDSPTHQLQSGERDNLPQNKNLSRITLEHIETSTVLRFELLQYINYLLSTLPRDACMQAIVSTISTTTPDDMKRLGSGAYGTVFLLPVKGLDVSVAFKVSALYSYHHASYIADLFREVIAMTFLNSMVRLGLSPNYPLLYEPFFCRNQTEFYIVEELSTGTLQQWFRYQRTETEVMTLIFQICTAIVGAQTMLGLVNNDVKPGNILFNYIDDGTVLAYIIYGTAYSIKTDTLFKMADWGLASGMGRLLQRDHNHVFELGSPITIKYFTDPTIWTKHDNQSYRYRDETGEALSAWKRDYLDLFYSLLRSSGTQKSVPTQYLLNAIQLVTGVANTSLEHNVGRVALFQQLFHPNFLEAASLDKNIFAVKGGKVQTFEMAGTINNESTQQLIYDDARKRLPQLI